MTFDINKQLHEAADHVKALLPEVKFNKTGYEIRSDILSMAKDMVQSEHSIKFAGWKMTQSRNSDGSISATVAMPEFPGLDKVLETAEKMYSFVNQNGKK